MTRRPPRLATFQYIGRHKYSLTFCALRRLRLFTVDTIVSDMLQQILQASRDWRFAILAYCFMPDHVHLLVSLGREWSIADLMRDVKSNSSGWVHDTIGLREFSWQAGYGAFSVSMSQSPQVKNYIAEQERHHTSVTYQDEFRQLLAKHGLEWDERYVWD